MRKLAFKDISNSIYDLSKALRIDAVIRQLARKHHGVRLQSRWVNNEEDALAFGRRVLDASAIMAKAAVEKDKSATIADLERLASLADDAGDRLRRLLRHIAQGWPLRASPIDAEGKAIPIRTLAKYPLHHMYFRDQVASGKRPEGRATLAQAERDCRTLCDAVEILQWLADYGKRTRDAVAVDFQNPGSPQKLSFARHMMEGWIFLVGTAPSERSSSFSNFLSESWNDICDVEAGDWQHSIRAARRSITRNDVITLRERGPTWA